MQRCLQYVSLSDKEQGMQTSASVDADKMDSYVNAERGNLFKDDASPPIGLYVFRQVRIRLLSFSLGPRRYINVSRLRFIILFLHYLSNALSQFRFVRVTV